MPATSLKSLQIALVSACPMGRSNGIGAQFIQLVEGADFSSTHFWWEAWDRMPSDAKNSKLLQRRLFSDRAARLWPIQKGRGRIANMLPELNLPGAAWKGSKLTDIGKRQLVSDDGKPFDVALVTPIRDEEAEHTLSILEVLACPYVFQVWDIMHAEGLNATDMPSFTRLLKGASKIVALTSAIADEVRKVHDGPIELMAFGRDTPTEPKQVTDEGPLRLAVLGFLDYYQDGIALLAEAWPHVRKTSPGAQLVVIGREDQLRYLPPSLRENVEFHSYPQDGERDRILSTCHAGFLPGPLSATTALGRFSIPCRIADYLHLGLPIVGTVAPKNSTALFLEEIRGIGFFPAQDVKALEKCLENLTKPEHQIAGSDSASGFAQKHLDMKRIRPRLIHILREAAGPMK